MAADLSRLRKAAMIAAAGSAIVFLGGCTLQVYGPRYDAHGSGGMTGFSREELQTPSLRTNDYRTFTAHHAPLSSAERDILIRAQTTAAITDAVRRAAGEVDAPDLSGPLRELATADLAAIDRLNASAGYLPVKNAGRSTQEFQAFRSRVEPLAGEAYNRALVGELVRLEQQTSADLDALSSSSNQDVRAFATTTREERSARLARAQDLLSRAGASSRHTS